MRKSNIHNNILRDEQMLVLEELKNLAEEDYKAFNNKIIPTKQTTLGVRLPILRRIAKRIAKEKEIEFAQLDKQNKVIGVSP
jgi:3-methyladenine DNA glycosylase AlkD